MPHRLNLQAQESKLEIFAGPKGRRRKIPVEDACRAFGKNFVGAFGAGNSHAHPSDGLEIVPRPNISGSGNSFLCRTCMEILTRYMEPKPCNPNGRVIPSEGVADFSILPDQASLKGAVVHPTEPEKLRMHS